MVGGCMFNLVKRCQTLFQSHNVLHSHHPCMRVLCSTSSPTLGMTSLFNFTHCNRYLVILWFDVELLGNSHIFFCEMSKSCADFLIGFLFYCWAIYYKYKSFVGYMLKFFFSSICVLPFHFLNKAFWRMKDLNFNYNLLLFLEGILQQKLKSFVVNCDYLLCAYV